MKTTNLFKAVAFVAMTIVSVMNTEVKAQENNFITNEEVKNELVVAKTIFKCLCHKPCETRSNVRRTW